MQHPIPSSKPKAALFATIAVFSLFTSAGCKPPDSGGTLVSPEPLQGTYNGKLWVAGTGTSKRFSPKSNTIVSTLSEVDLEACDPRGFETLEIEIPFKPGVYPLDLTRAVHFVYNNGVDDLAATDGEIIVHEVSDQIIRAGIYAIYNDNPNYEVSGQFIIARCPF